MGSSFQRAVDTDSSILGFAEVSKELAVSIFRKIQGDTVLSYLQST
jgi:hypothetical protein